MILNEHSIFGGLRKVGVWRGFTCKGTLAGQKCTRPPCMYYCWERVVGCIHPLIYI